jgi:hypothetical protein
MAYFTGFQNEGEQTYGPFLPPLAGEAGPQIGFIADLRLFLSGRHEYTAYLKSVSYDTESDSWTLVFADPLDQSVLVSGTLPRTSGGQRLTKGSIGSGATVAVFLTGEYWGDPTWGGEGSWTKTYQPNASEVEASKTLGGPKTIRRIIIDGQQDPFNGEYPRDSNQSIIGGYNIQFSDSSAVQGTIISPITASGNPVNTVFVSAGYGLGDGEPPASESSELNILTINGLRADESNNFVISSKDCIKVTVPPQTEDGRIIEHEIQIESECGPCCGCEGYRGIAEAIKLNYSKIVSLQSTLRSIYDSTYATYKQGLEDISKMRTSK